MSIYKSLTTQRNPAPPSNGNHQSVNNGSRPSSFYDNCLENENTTRETEFGGSPTQTHCLMTTVPQNIAAESFANKHTPNRNSLRHSRMIATLNKNGKVSRKYLPPIIRYHKLAKALLGLILLLGLAICFLSLWLLIWTPNIRQRDNPHWSGIPVLLSGLLGLVLVCCFHKEHPAMEKSYFVYSMKALSIGLSTIAAVLAFTAGAFCIVHLMALYTMSCTSTDTLDTTCICRAERNNTTTSGVPSYHYVDLSCLEVDNILSILVIFSCASNLLAGILEIWYVYLHWASRYVYTYSQVRTNEDQPTVLTNLR